MGVTLAHAGVVGDVQDGVEGCRTIWTSLVNAGLSLLVLPSSQDCLDESCQQLVGDVLGMEYEQRGVPLLVCLTFLNSYSLADKVRVGTVGGMPANWDSKCRGSARPAGQEVENGSIRCSS
jgi:hypothetical protein